MPWSQNSQWHASPEANQQPPKKPCGCSIFGNRDRGLSLSGDSLADLVDSVGRDWLGRCRHSPGELGFYNSTVENFSGLADPTITMRRLWMQSVSVDPDWETGIESCNDLLHPLPSSLFWTSNGVLIPSTPKPLPFHCHSHLAKPFQAIGTTTVDPRRCHWGGPVSQQHPPTPHPERRP